MRKASIPVRPLHKMGLAINLGGTLFGLVALHPSVTRVGDRRERGRVLNEAWTRFQAVGTLTMGLTVATWRLGGLKQAESDLDATLGDLETSSWVELSSRASRRRSRAGGSRGRPRRATRRWSRGPSRHPRRPRKRTDRGVWARSWASPRWR